MLKKLLAATALVIATPVMAQSIGSFVVPSDLTSLPGGGYTAVPPQYKTDGTRNVAIDPSVTPPPAYAYELTNIPIPSTTGRITTGTWADDDGGFCTEVINGGTDARCLEAKFRTHADFSHMLPDDPVRNFGAPGTSHLHCFFGAGSANGNSTYASLRKHALDSTAAGTDANGTGYWFPCLIDQNPFGDGKNYALRSNWISIYYVDDPSKQLAHLPGGLRYVFGYNMDDAGAWLQPYIDAANAASSNHSRYRASNGTQIDHEAPGSNFTCQGAVAVHRLSGVDAISGILKETDGSDPYNGTCNGANIMGYVSGTTLTVTAVNTGTVPHTSGSFLSGQGVITDTTITGQLTGTPGGVGTYSLDKSATAGSAGSPIRMDAAQDFYIGISGPDCWDGTNFWSPGGYKHVIPAIYDTVFAESVCPINYYMVPHINLEIKFTQYGWADRQHWVLSSDLAKRTATGGDNSTIPAGSTFHTDWLNGWDLAIMAKWQQNCLGTDGHVPHQCSTSIISPTESLTAITAVGAGGRNPQVDLTPLPHNLSTDSGLMLVPSAWSGPMTNMKVEHH